MMMLPKEYIQRMQEQLGSEFSAYLAAMKEPSGRSIRINTLRASVERAKELLGVTKSNGVVAQGFMATDELDGKNVYHACGLYYIQEASAQLPASLLDVKKGMAVLDLCAAPGGKSTQLAAYLGGTGVLVANEIVPKRAQILTSNIERMGITNAIVTNMTPRELCSKLHGCFDAVLVDAPCAGEGMFRKDERAILEWSREHVLSCADRQREILSSAQTALKDGGRLVYSTCSFSKEENEDVASWFVDKYPEFELVETRRLYPHNSKGEGQFAAVFIKRGILSQSTLLDEQKRTLPDGRELIIPKTPFRLDGLHIIRAGLLVGEQRNKVFVPSHAMAMADRLDNRVELCQSEMTSYLHGEVIFKQADRGWCTMRYNGFPLGLGKSTFEGIKNHLPKGLLLM
ncbi:MAG: RsmF rRNA methyltransferase first C-terminal domain-containing protein [Eubacteriales bacterium]|nr:RsmF rRNA methyltransferase first C-terminal domain-containing protein [Eubacteriales bacterium]